MRWAVVGVVVIAVALSAMFAVAPPGRVLSRPRMAECERYSSGRPAEKTTVGWVWASKGWGWGCRYSYPDGSSGTTVFR